MGILAVLAVLSFFVAPAVLAQLSEEQQVAGVMILFVFNTALFAVVGWQSNYVPKIAIWVPLLFGLVYAASEAVQYGTITWNLELNYMETAYVAYFIKKLLTRQQMIQQKKENKPFPKGVGKK